MGNKPMTIGVRTDQQCYRAGSTVTGRVYVSVTNQAQAVDCLMLKIVGEESAVVHRTTQHSSSSSSSRRRGQRRHSTTGSRTQHHYERANVLFLQLEYPLTRYNTASLPPGQYEYPFVIQLPPSLPSSMMCRKGESHAQVKYQIVATMHKSNAGIFNSNPSALQRLQLMATVPYNSSIKEQQPPQEQHLPLEHVPVQKCCCFGRAGSMSLEVKVDKTIIQPQDVVNVQFSGTNKSSVKVKEVRVQLEQIIEWQCHGYKEQVRTTLDQRVLDANQYPELQEISPQRARQQYFGVPQAEHFLSNHHEWHASQLRIPAESQDSMNGRAIQIRHVLSVQLRTKGCCTTNPESGARMQLYRSVVAAGANNNADDDPLLLVPPQEQSTPASAPMDIYDNEAGGGSKANHQTAIPLVAAVEPSAPSDIYNDGEESLPVAEAQALPPDWNAQTAEVVNIPMAEAVILDPQIIFKQ